MQSKPSEIPAWATRAIKAGVVLGYGDCCIREFITTLGEFKPPRRLSGTGFIPCIGCAKKSEPTLIREINSRRTYPERFQTVCIPEIDLELLKKLSIAVPDSKVQKCLPQEVQ